MAEHQQLLRCPCLAWQCSSQQWQIAAGRQVKDERDPSGSAKAHRILETRHAGGKIVLDLTGSWTRSVRRAAQRTK
jgi:hypothetical protein